tara:strand:- start:121 stop:738 length:618 start_codon:yes stop_codon:yes gene_type:complete
MKTTDKLERGVNNVKFIRPLTPANYMQRSVYALHDHYTDEISDRRRIVTDARSEITGSTNRYFDDLIGAYRQWVMYKSDPRLDIKPYEYSEALADRLDTYLSTAAESDELLQNVTSDMYQVRTTEDGFEVNRLDLQLNNNKTRFGSDPVIIHPVQTYKGDELPRSIANKLGVLDMTHAETDQQDIKFILGVGYTQIKGHLYYVTA